MKNNQSRFVSNLGENYIYIKYSVGIAGEGGKGVGHLNKTFFDSLPAKRVLYGQMNCLTADI